MERTDGSKHAEQALIFDARPTYGGLSPLTYAGADLSPLIPIPRHGCIRGASCVHPLPSTLTTRQNKRVSMPDLYPRPMRPCVRALCAIVGPREGHAGGRWGTPDPTAPPPMWKPKRRGCFQQTLIYMRGIFIWLKVRVTRCLVLRAAKRRGGKLKALIDYLQTLTLTGGDLDGERFTVLPWESRFIRNSFAQPRATAH